MMMMIIIRSKAAVAYLYILSSAIARWEREADGNESTFKLHLEAVSVSPNYKCMEVSRHLPVY